MPRIHPRTRPTWAAPTESSSTPSPTSSGAAIGSDAESPQTSSGTPASLAAAAAREAGIPLEVCGDSASDPIAAPLLVGLSVDELSVGAAQVGRVRGWVRSMDHGALERTAREALSLSCAEEVERLVLQGGDAAREGGDGRESVVAVGPQA